MDGLRKLLFALPAVAVAGVIFYMSSLEKIDLPLSGISFNDLLFHGAGYLVFGLTLLLAAQPWGGLQAQPIKTCVILLAVGMAYALSDEIHQSLVPNRDCSLADFLADSLGVAIAIAGWLVHERKHRQEGGL